MPDGNAPIVVADSRGLLGLSTIVAWVARAAWLVVAIVGGDAIGQALADRSRALQFAGTIGSWVGWGMGAAALAVAGVATLTVARSVIPASLVVAAAALIGGTEPGAGGALVVPAAVAAAAVCSAEFGRVYIQASAYGDEQRFGLRPPIGYLVASAVSWLATATALVITPLAWAANAWFLAVAVTVVAAAGLALLPIRWHQLSRRWLVLVPAGVVVHDPVVLNDTLMMPSRTIVSVTLDELGIASQTAADLTGPTPGLGVEITLAESTSVVFAATPSNPTGRVIHLTALVVSPTRPGSVIRAARRVGTARPGGRDG